MHRPPAGQLQGQERQRLIDGGAIVDIQSRLGGADHQVGVGAPHRHDRKDQPTGHESRVVGLEAGRLGRHRLDLVSRRIATAPREHSPARPDHPRAQCVGAAQDPQQPVKTLAVLGGAHEGRVSSHGGLQHLLAVARESLDECLADGDERQLERHSKQRQGIAATGGHQPRRYRRTGCRQPVSKRGDAGPNQRPHKFDGARAGRDPNAGSEDHLVTLEVAGGIRQLGGVHPAHAPVEITLDHLLEAEVGVVDEIADGQGHWMFLQRQ